MAENSVYLVTELWILPDSFSKLKEYRRRSNAILEKYNPEYIFHNHGFEWVCGSEGEDYPTGIEIIKFESEEKARSALAELNNNELSAMEDEVFARIRAYLSRHAFPDGMVDNMYAL